MASPRRPRFSADLSQCLFDFVIQLLPPPDELHVKENVRRLLQRLIRNIQPNCRLLAFGSTANGFSLRNSDMDLCCLIDSPERLNPADLVTILGDLLERETRFHVKPLPHARIPIVKLSLDPSPGLPSGIACDIGFENRLAIENTRLLLTYAKIDPTRVRTLVLFLKIWSKRRKINSPYKGTLSSYGYVLLVIYFLVHVKNPPVLPNLQQMPPLRPINKDDTTLNGYNVWFFDDTDILCQRWQSENTESVAELLIDFFRYFSRDFLYNTGVASIRAGLLKKDAKGWQNDLSPTSGRYDPARERNRFCIEDPFETDYNVARCVTKDGLYTIRGEFMRASRILSIRPERAIIALAELCEERKEEDLVSAPSHHPIPYVGTHAAPAKLSIPPQTPYSIGSQSRRVAPGLSPRMTMSANPTYVLQVVDEHSILTTNKKPPVEPVDVPLPPSPTSDTIPPVLNNTPHIASPVASFLNTIPTFVPQSTIPAQPHPEHMAPRRSKWTSPPPADASFVDRTMYENSLDRSLELATAPVGEARERYRCRKKRSKRDGEDRWEEEEEIEMEMETEEEEEVFDDVGSVVETLSEVGSVRSFTEGMVGNNAIMNFSGVLGVGPREGFLRRPSWHVMDSLPRGWVPPSFVPSSDAMRQVSQQREEVNDVGSPTPTRNGFSQQHNEEEVEVPRGSTSPRAVSAGQPSPPTSFRSPSIAYPISSSSTSASSSSAPYTRRSRPPLQHQSHSHSYRQQNRGGYYYHQHHQHQQHQQHGHQHQPHPSSPLTPFYDTPPESVSPGSGSNFDSPLLLSVGVGASSTSTTTGGGGGRYNNGGGGGYFGVQKVRGERGEGSPSSVGVTQSPRFHRQHQHHQHHQHYQHRNTYGGYHSPQQQQQQQQQSPQSPSSSLGLAAFDSYAIQLAMNTMNTMNAMNNFGVVGGSFDGMSAVSAMNVMNVLNAASPITSTRTTTTTTTADGGNEKSSSNNGTTVYYQTTAPRSPRIVLPVHSNMSSPQIGGGGSSTPGSGSGSNSPVVGMESKGGRGVEEDNVLSPSLPSIGLLRHGQRNGISNGGGGGGGFGYGSGMYAGSSAYQRIVMASSLRNMEVGFGYQRNGYGEDGNEGDDGGNQGEVEEGVVSSPITTPVQSSLVREDEDGGGDGDTGCAGGGGGVEVGSTTSSSSARSSTATDITAATTAMTALSSSPPVTTTTTTLSSPAVASTSTPATAATAATNGANASRSASNSAKAKAKSRGKSRIGGGGGGGNGKTKAKSKSRSPSPFVGPVLRSSPSVGGCHSPSVSVTTARITKEEEERFHSGSGGGGGKEEKGGGKSNKKNGERKNGNVKNKTNGNGNAASGSTTTMKQGNGGGGGNSGGTGAAGAGGPANNSKARGKQKGKQRRGGNNNNNGKKGGDQPVEKPPSAAVASTSGTATATAAGGGNAAGNSS